jgi:hypothetical protein
VHSCLRRRRRVFARETARRGRGRVRKTRDEGSRAAGTRGRLGRKPNGRSERTSASATPKELKVWPCADARVAARTATPRHDKTLVTQRHEHVPVRQHDGATAGRPRGRRRARAWRGRGGMEKSRNEQKKEPPRRTTHSPLAARRHTIRARSRKRYDKSGRTFSTRQRASPPRGDEVPGGGTTGGTARADEHQLSRRRASFTGNVEQKKTTPRSPHSREKTNNAARQHTYRLHGSTA